MKRTLRVDKGRKPTSSRIERILDASRTRPVLAIEVVAGCQEQRRCDACHDCSSQRAAEASCETDHGVTPIRSPWKGGYSPALFSVDTRGACRAGSRSFFT